MSCKGLVELIVLNIGLQAKILSVRTFTIFVVMALVTTFATTPLTTLLYPKWYQEKLEMWKKGKIDWDGNPILPDDTSSDRAKTSSELNRPSATRQILVYLRLDGLPSLFSLISLMSSPAAYSTKSREHYKIIAKKPRSTTESDNPFQQLRKPLQVHGLRLLELTDRNSSVMKVSELEEYTNRDPVVKAFHTFAASKEVTSSADIAVIPERAYASTLLSQAREMTSDLIIIPWSETGSMSEQASFLAGSQWSDPLVNQAFTSFVEETFANANSANVGVFVDRAILPVSRALRSRAYGRQSRQLTKTHTGISLNSNHEHQALTLISSNNGYHILVPFFGGEDDCFAVRLALQIAWNENVTATILLMYEASSSATPARNGADDASFFFNAMRTNLPEPLGSRVVFEECSREGVGGLQAVLADLDQSFRAADKPEQIIIHGLSGHPDSSDAAVRPTSRSSAQAKTGLLNHWLLSILEEMEFEASLLVVQAKKQTEDGGNETLKRRQSHVEEITTSAKDEDRAE